jgi:hypothetical protein
VTLVFGRAHELIPGHDAEAQGRAWGLCTTSFAICQAAGAYGFSYVFNATSGSYLLLFELGAAAFLAAFIIDLVVALLPLTRTT